MPTNTITLSITNQGTRASIRSNVISHFLNEIPGTGRGQNASKYIYFVETLGNGNRIFLTRPQQHGGFDFRVHVENTVFLLSRLTRNAPRHQEIINDLAAKRTNNPNNYRILYGLIQNIFNCNNVSPVSYAHLNFTNGGFDIDLILYVLKWLFIEQDCAYWNYSGRNMLIGGIPIP